ncbi:MAG: VOC family protein, partial [Elusimicrobiota bacterium]|nr:VOC family protein [Elusimicrobiota bacterium]
MNIHHIGYLVKNIKSAIVEFKKLGFTVDKDLIFDENRIAYFSLLKKDGYTVELISPKDEKSPIYGL